METFNYRQWPYQTPIRPEDRYGSNSEVELADADFRFTPQSRHPAAGLACPKSATCRLMHRSELHLYSITSSARASTVAGMSMRSDFAVLRLIRRWNFVGSITGNSDGFSPFTIRPA
jgi:hypothetical protein